MAVFPDADFLRCDFFEHSERSPDADTTAPARARVRCGENALRCGYLGGAGGGVKISRLRPASGFGFGFGAFFASLPPLSLFPMRANMPQKRRS
jgi:hypothetical protein